MLRIVFRGHKNGFLANDDAGADFATKSPWGFSARLYSLSFKVLLPGNHYFILGKISAQKFCYNLFNIGA